MKIRIDAGVRDTDGEKVVAIKERKLCLKVYEICDSFLNEFFKRSKLVQQPAHLPVIEVVKVDFGNSFPYGSKDVDDVGRGDNAIFSVVVAFSFCADTSSNPPDGAKMKSEFVFVVSSARILSSWRADKIARRLAARVFRGINRITNRLERDAGWLKSFESGPICDKVAASGIKCDLPVGHNELCDFIPRF